jgi:hypothetical protein
MVVASHDTEAMLMAGELLGDNNFGTIEVCGKTTAFLLVPVARTRGLRVGAAAIA